MKNLRAAAYVAMLGGLILGFRWVQAFVIEVSYDGPHYPFSTVPVFLLAAGVAMGSLWSGALFLKNPTRLHAVRVSRAGALSLWVVLFSLRLDAMLALVLAFLAYFTLLKPAVLREYRVAIEPSPSPDRTRDARGSA